MFEEASEGSWAFHTVSCLGCAPGVSRVFQGVLRTFRGVSDDFKSVSEAFKGFQSHFRDSKGLQKVSIVFQE